MTTARYAIYFAPDPQSRLWRRGSVWLGRDAATGEKIERGPNMPLDPVTLNAMTAMPARYGFHATLKPPMRLVEEQTPDALCAAAEAFASRHVPVRVPRLRVRDLSDFIALVPEPMTRQISDLAAACVREFDEFRAPPREDEIARRREADLTPVQQNLLVRWGYPYVMEAFRFHMTLTGSLKPKQRMRLVPLLEDYFADVIADPIQLDAITVFEQPEAGSSFRVLKQFALAGGVD